MKINKMQIDALCEKIKREAKEIIAEKRIELRKLFVLTPEDQIIYDEAKALEKAMSDFREKYKGLNFNPVYSYGIDPDGFYRNSCDKWVNPQLPVYNFDTLREDLVLSSMTATSVDELVEQALETYKK